MNSRQILTPVLLASSLLLGSPVLAQDQPAAAPPEAEVQQLNFRTTSNFGLALGHLEGATDNLSVINLERRIEGWTELFTDMFGSEFIQDAFEEEGIPEEFQNFDFDPVLELLGIANFTTYAQGAEETQNGWVMRTFLGIDGEATGLFALGGKENQPWQATQIATKEDDIILEFTLDTQHLGAWLLESLELLNETFPPEFQQQLAEEEMLDVDPMAMAFLNPEMLKEPVLPSGQSILEFLTELGQPRISLIINLPPSEDMPELIFDMQEAENPMLFLEAGGSLTIAIDKFEPILELIEPAFAEQGFETREENGLQITSFLPEGVIEQMGFPEGMLAQLSYNPESTSALLELGKPAAAARGSIQQSADFAACTSLFPEAGTSMSWVSKNTIDSLYTIFESAMEEDMGGEEAEYFDKFFIPLMSRIYGLPEKGAAQGVAAASFWVEGGILSLGSSPVAPADGSLTGITYISIMAAVAVPATTAVLKNARKAEATANARNLCTALIAYGLDNGEYPETLEELFTEGYLDEGARQLLSINSKWDPEWNYRPVIVNAPADSIILWARVNDQEYLAATIAGAVLTLSPEEFRELAEEQEIELVEEFDFGQFF